MSQSYYRTPIDLIFFLYFYIYYISHIILYSMPYRVALKLFLFISPPLQIKFLHTISTLNALILIKILNYCSFKIVNLFGKLMFFCLTKFRMIQKNVYFCKLIMISWYREKRCDEIKQSRLSLDHNSQCFE